MSAMTKRCIISALLRAILLRGHGVVRCDQEFISSAVYLAFMFAAFPCPDLDLELRQGLLPDLVLLVGGLAARHFIHAPPPIVEKCSETVKRCVG